MSLHLLQPLPLIMKADVGRDFVSVAEKTVEADAVVESDDNHAHVFYFEPRQPQGRCSISHTQPLRDAAVELLTSAVFAVGEINHGVRCTGKGQEKGS